MRRWTQVEPRGCLEDRCGRARGFEAGDGHASLRDGRRAVGTGTDAAIRTGRVDHRRPSVEERVGHRQQRIHLRVEAHDGAAQYRRDEFRARRTTGQRQVAAPVGGETVGEDVGLRGRRDSFPRESAEEGVGQHLQVDVGVLRAGAGADVRDVWRISPFDAQRARQRHGGRRHGDRHIGEVRLALAQLAEREGACALHHRTATAQLCQPQRFAGHQLIAEADGDDRIEPGGERGVHQLHRQRGRRREEGVVAEDGDGVGGSVHT